MSKSKDNTSKKLSPAHNPDNRENQLIYLATELAEEKLRNGTASSQLIVHYLKMGSSKEKIEKEILEKQKELITAKTEALKTNKQIESMYAEAITAMRKYNGDFNENEEEL